MVAAQTPLGADRGQRRRRASAPSTSRTARRWTSGRRRPRAGFELHRDPEAARAVPRRHQRHQRPRASAARTGGDASAGANHTRSAAVFLTRRHAEAGAQAHLGDHRRPGRRAAHRPGHAAAVARAVDRGRRRSAASDGFSCAYRNTISWQTPTTPLPMENNPQVVFERLFGDGSTDAERRGAPRSRRAACSTPCSSEVVVAADGRCRPATAARVDQYLDDVREIERRIQRAAKRQARRLDAARRAGRRARRRSRSTSS